MHQLKCNFKMSLSWTTTSKIHKVLGYWFCLIMGKRYYCDYCDKTFPDNTLNRKKHNEGSFHQMMKNNYYAQFKGIHF